MTRLHAVDYEQGKALFEVGDRFVVVDTSMRDVLQIAETQEALTASASWLKVSPALDYPDVWRELAEAAVTTLEVEEHQQPPAERKFKVPVSVQEEAAQAINWVTGFERANSAVGMAIAKKLVENTYITQSEISRIHRYFSRISNSMTEAAGWSPGENGYPTDERIRFAMRGGSAGREWVNKIAVKHPITAAGEEALDAEGNITHSFVDDPEVPGFCEICGRDSTAEIHQSEPASTEEQFPEDNDYFGKGSDPDTTVVTELYAHRPDDTWAMYDGTGWVDIPAPDETAVIIMLDDDSVQTLAQFIRDRDPENQQESIELSMLNPHEAALFALADPEIDWSMVDRMFDIYDSQERSVNAKKQVRAPGGKFGSNPDTEEAKQAGAPKARLPLALPLVQDVAGLIQQYLGGGPAQQSEQPVVEGEQPGGPVTAAAINAAIDNYNYLALATRQLYELAEVAPQGDAAPQAAPAPAVEEQTAPARPLYLAVVDSVDTQAVLDVIAIMPGPVLWKRDAGQWLQDPNLLAQLQGTQPPAVVELTEDAMVADVLQQVDKSTSGGASEQEEAQAPGATEQRSDGSSGAKPDANPDQHPVPVAAAGGLGFGGSKAQLARRGYALPDGSMPIVDSTNLRDAIDAYSTSRNQAQAQQHIVRRARALGRLDLLPSDWSTENSSAEYSLYGPNGELMSLSADGGVDKNRGGAEKLRRYWLTGEGGTVKVRWNTPGDWTRCYKHLRKYMGERAKGYCTLRHHEATGRWPGERDSNGNL